MIFFESCAGSRQRILISKMIYLFIHHRYSGVVVTDVIYTRITDDRDVIRVMSTFKYVAGTFHKEKALFVEQRRFWSICMHTLHRYIEASLYVYAVQPWIKNFRVRASAARAFRHRRQIWNINSKFCASFKEFFLPFCSIETIIKKNIRNAFNNNHLAILFSPPRNLSNEISNETH